MEYEAELAEFRQLTRRSGLMRLAASGKAWTPIRPGRSFYNSLNQRIVEIFGPEDTDPDHGFEHGRPVVFTLSDRCGDSLRFLFNGSVSFVDGNRMGVAVAENADLSLLDGGDAAEAGVILSFDETSYRTMFEAIDRTAAAKGRLGELRDIVYSQREAGFRASGSDSATFLNDAQREGVRLVTRARDVAVVHGPPGTGKTTTLVEAIYETLRRETQVLVCAQSNMAVDWICEKLTERGISVLRIGNPARVTDNMLSYTYERRFEDHPDYPALWSLRKEIRRLKGARRKGDRKAADRLDALESKATELEIRISRSILDNAGVIASTLVGSASRLLEGRMFDTLFIDEAAQAMEAAAWIPARLARRMILAGDHCQLPPTVKCFEAARQGLASSLMERIVDNHPEAVTLLTLQYRMNEEIMRFSSDWFYGGRLQAAPEVKGRGILDFDSAIEWIDTDCVAQMLADADSTPGNAGDAVCDASDNPQAFREASPEGSEGRINYDEALLTLLTLQRYVERIGMERFIDERIDVGLISPYRAQVRLLRRMIASTPFFRPLRRMISVNTVDGFQGQERDVIVLSLVRSNENGDIGFLRDLRRMNVAMTRARMKLLIIGSARTLGSHTFYRRLQQAVEATY